MDETGEFAFGNGASRLYGVSFVFHEQDDNIKKEINNLNDRLKRIGYTDMIHMAELIAKRGDYANFSIKKRKSIFNAIYEFSNWIPAKYISIFIDKKYINNNKILRQQLINIINEFITYHINYFNKFDKIVMYYDNGQEILSNILIQCFSKFNNFTHISNFNHKEKILFQVADMLTFIDKYNFKYKNKLSFTKSEKYFFNDFHIKEILKRLRRKRF